MFFGKASSFPGGSILVPCPTMCSDCEIELEAFKRSLDAYPNYEEMVLTDLLADPNVPTPGRGASQLAMQHFTTRLRCALVDPTVFGKLVGAIPWAGRPKNADSVLSLMALQFGTSLENLKAFSSEWQQYVAKLGRDGLHPEDRAPGLAILAKYELDKIIPKVDRSNDPRLNQDSIDDASGLLVDGAILVLTASEGNALKFALARMSENLGRELTAAEVAALAENRELLSAIWSTLKTSGCACFPANTPVLMGDGTRKAIAAIRAGDLVWSRDAATGKSGPQAVTATPSLLHTDRVTLSLATPSGKAETLLTTLQHPFWVEGKGFAPASALRAGDRIGSADEPAQGPLLAVASRWNDTSGALLVKAVTVEADGVAPWMGYNLTVAASHTFFVGKAGAWVHNTSLSCGFRILTHSEARALGYDGTKGVVFVLETPGKKNGLAYIYEAATEGAASDLASGRRIVPALLYRNANDGAYHYLKLDGFETVGQDLILLDSKTRLAIRNGLVKDDQVASLRRLEQALSQNPGQAVKFQFPTLAARDEAELAIGRQVPDLLKFNDFSMEVRP